MKKILILASILLFNFSILKAEIIKNIIINGNERVSDETIKIYGEVQLNQEFKESDLNLILKNLYETEFFEDVKVSFNNNILTIDLKEYPIINQLIIVGEKSKKYKERIIEVINSKEKRSLIKSNLAKDIDLIKFLYSSLGYNFVKVESKIEKN